MEQPIILLAEDNEDDIELIQIAFSDVNIGNHLVVVRDGQAVLDYLFAEGPYKKRSRADHPQVLLLDLGLPKVSGIEVLERLREDPRTEYMPIVVLTSDTDQASIINSYQHGANSVVRKPLTIRGLMRAAQQLGLYWIMVNELPKQWRS